MTKCPTCDSDAVVKETFDNRITYRCKNSDCEKRHFTVSKTTKPKKGLINYLAIKYLTST